MQFHLVRTGCTEDAQGSVEVQSASRMWMACLVHTVMKGPLQLEVEHHLGLRLSLLVRLEAAAAERD